MIADLSGRTAVVTGGARGIGFAIAEVLAGHGSIVVVADITGTADAVDAIRENGFRAAGFDVDVTDAAQIGELVSFAESQPGALDILVNNAGTTASTTVVDTPEADWRRIIDVNLTGAFLCSKAVLPGMRARNHGRIVNIASIAAKRISFNSGAGYTASKSGLLGFTRHLAYEEAPHGINVNAVCPGPVLTPMIDPMVDQAALAQRLRNLPAGRFPTPQDQADAVLFLVSDAAAMVFGQAIDVDGGALLGWYDTATYSERRRASAIPTIPSSKGLT